MSSQTVGIRLRTVTLAEWPRIQAAVEKLRPQLNPDLYVTVIISDTKENDDNGN